MLHMKRLVFSDTIIFDVHCLLMSVFSQSGQMLFLSYCCLAKSKSWHVLITFSLDAADFVKLYVIGVTV